MGRKATPKVKLNKIKQYVEKGHTYDEAVNKFKCAKMTVIKAVNPEAHERIRQKQLITKRLITAAVTLQKIKAKGFIVSIEGNTIHVLDSRTGLSVKIEDDGGKPEKKGRLR